MDQQVGALGFAAYGVRLLGVAAEHHAAPLVADAIAHCRLDRGVVDREGDDLEIGVLDQLGPAVGAERKGSCDAAEARGVHGGLAMVSHPVALVGRVGLPPSGDHRVDPGRSIDRHRCLVAGRDPALQHQFAQAIHVVRMEVRQEDGLDAAVHEPQSADIARRTAAGIEHEQSLAGHHHRARTGALVVREGRAGAAHAHMQAIGQFAQQVGGEPIAGNVPRQRDAQRAAKGVGRRAQQGGRNEGPEGDAGGFHAGFRKSVVAGKSDGWWLGQVAVVSGGLPGQTPTMRARRTPRPWIQGAV